MSDTKELQIGLNSYVEITKGATHVSGLINGMKLQEEGLYWISFYDIDANFYMHDGWMFVDDSEEEEEEEIG